jgi:hypothetical protein
MTMNDNHEVISAFLDDEPFDASELAAALSEPGGRDLLIDLVALHHLVQAGGHEVSVRQEQPPRTGFRAWAAAAAVLVALAGGYLVGERQSQAPESAPPAATRVVEAPSTWQTLP